VITILDCLFIYSFISLGSGILLTGVRIALFSNNTFLISSSSILIASGLATTIIACLWMFLDIVKQPSSKSAIGDWRTVLRRYPVLVGPAAYYLGEYRNRHGHEAQWFAQFLKSRIALDSTVLVAWRGVLAMLVLIPSALIAATVQSSLLFMSIVVLFAVLIPISGWAFCLLAVAVIVHAIQRPVHGMKRARPPWAVVPLVGVFWVSGFRKYYWETIRPSLK
jgi:hypothetical protein